MSNSAYCVRAEGGVYARAFRDGGYAAIGWMGDDVSSISQVNIDALGAKYDSAYPENRKLRRGQNGGQISRCIWKIDSYYVAVTPTQQSEYLLVGGIGSPYYREVRPNVRTDTADASRGRIRQY